MLKDIIKNIENRIKKLHKLKENPFYDINITLGGILYLEEILSDIKKEGLRILREGTSQIACLSSAH